MTAGDALGLLAVAVAAGVTAWLLVGDAGRRAGRLVAVRSGDRPPASAPGPDVTAPLVLELLAVALQGGAETSAALDVVGGAVGGPVGEALTRAAALLALGASWPDAWAPAAGPGGRRRGAARASTSEVVGCVERELGFAVDSGAAAADTLVDRAQALRAEHRRRLEGAAGALGVKLVFPLGLCFLPAFGLLGVVPVVVSLVRGLLG